MLPSEDLYIYKLNCLQEVRTRYQYHIQKVGGRVRLATNYKLGFFCLNNLLFVGLTLFFVSALFQII